MNMTPPETIIMITTLTTSIVSITNAILGKKADATTKEKLDVIHEQTNGGWARAHQDLSMALREIIELKKLLAAGKDAGA